MSKYKRLSGEERWLIIKPIIENRVSINSVAKASEIAKSVIDDWVKKYKRSGMSGLENGKGWKQYSAELKNQAVNDVLSNGMSQRSVTAKYEISI